MNRSVSFLIAANSTRLIAAFILLVLLNPQDDRQAFGETHKVRSADEISELIDSQSIAPGDVLLWTDGEYSDQEINLNGVNGKSDRPITLRAATPGGVMLLGESQIRTNAQWWVIEGFHFAGQKGKPNAYNPIQFRGSGDVGAEHVRLTNCAFTDLDNGEATAKWVLIYGRFNRVDHCHFSGKPNKGALLTVELGAIGNDHTAEHMIEWNYFADIPPKNGSDNEAIRLGHSGDQNKPARCTVQHNLFQRCDGEPEVVSNKSSYNTYQANTFRQCNGSLVLRHGHHATVQGNYFLGDGAKDSGGIRINDSHHKIFNNYIQDLTGLTWNAALSIEGGKKKSGGDSNGYQTVDNLVVVHNTIVNCAKGIFLNDAHGKRTPTGIVANNLIVATHNKQILIDIKLSPENLSWRSNLLFGSNSIPKAIGPGNQLSIDPKLTKTNGQYYLTAPSPMIDAASDGFAFVKDDIHQRERPQSAKDIGAEEFTEDPANEKHSSPLTVAQVGVSFRSRIEK